MYDMEQYSFCKILDKMTNPIWREKKYTGEDPESQLRQNFVFFCSSPSSRSFWGKFHHSGMLIWHNFFFFFYVRRIQAKSITEREPPPLLFQQGSRPEIYTERLFLLLAWNGLDQVQMDWSKRSAPGVANWSFLLGSSVLRSNKGLRLRGTVGFFICSITHFYWDFIGIQCSLL